jgi:adenylate kinase family enzyme
MKRVAVLGSPGAGKTWFSNELSKVTGIPVIYLDQHFHAKQYDSQGQEWYKKVEDLLKSSEWIVDGIYSSTFELRFDKADTIIMLDFSRRLSLYGVFKRRVLHQSKHREEMPEGWKERMTWDFLRFIWTFDKKYKPRIYGAISQKNSEKLIVLRDRMEARAFIKKIAAANNPVL